MADFSFEKGGLNVAIFVLSGGYDFSAWRGDSFYKRTSDSGDELLRDEMVWFFFFDYI